MALLFVAFSRGFDFILSRKMEQILLACSLPKETVTAIKWCSIKYKSKSSFTGWRHRILWHYYQYSSKGYISPISVHNLPRQHTLNINWANERKWFYTKKVRSRQCTALTIMDTDYMDDIAHLATTPTQAESLLHSLKQAACNIGLHVNAGKMEYMCFNQKEDNHYAIFTYIYYIYFYIMYFYIIYYSYYIILLYIYIMYIYVFIPIYII